MVDGRTSREIFHYCFLERLLKIADPNLFVLKGGVNLRFFFHSPRYSEDMDIDVLAGSVSTLKKNGYKLLDDPAFHRTLRTYGIAEVEVNDRDLAKHTQTTQRFRVQLVTSAGEKLPSKVEFSRRASESDALDIANEPIDPEIAHQHKRLSFRCRHYTGEAAVLQKVSALAGRTITQARDVFDLEILRRGGHTGHVQLRTQLSTTTCTKALENLASLKFADFAGQVLEFLDDDSRSEFGERAVWDSLVAAIRKMLSDR